MKTKNEKNNEYKKRYRDANKEKTKDYMLRHRYGITLKQREQMFEAQGKCCALCKSNKSDSNSFVVDHCHKTGKVRGILCSYCNRALGMFRDNVDILNKAISYLNGDF